MQPFVALSFSLKTAGHAVTLCGAPGSSAFVEQCGVQFAPIGADFKIFELPRTRELLQQGRVSQYFREGAPRISEMWGGLGRDLVALVQNADAIVCSGMLADWGYCIAQKFGRPVVLAYTFPLVANGDYPNPFVTTSRLPFAWVRRLTHRLYEWASWSHLRPMIDDLRRSLDLPMARRPVIGDARAAGIVCLHMWSAAVAPRPAEWTERDILTGYWRLPSALRRPLGEEALPDGLSEWLAKGSPPVYVGFGGWPIEDANASLMMARRVARKLGYRIVCGFGGRVSPTTSNPDDSIFIVGSIDHERLFPLCQAAVHHGGAGTTGASLTAGIPTVVCSVFADQPLWGAQVVRLGVGAHLPFSKLDEHSLAAALKKITRERVRARANNLGAELRNEDGLGKAIAVIETQFQPHRARISATAT
jgi:sterol 3beta-glucosyltransferase